MQHLTLSVLIATTYGISGTITVIVRGAVQSVYLTSDAVWASLTFRK